MSSIGATIVSKVVMVGSSDHWLKAVVIRNPDDDNATLMMINCKRIVGILVVAHWLVGFLIQKLVVMGRTPFYRTSFFEHRTNSNVFIYSSNSNTLFFASNDRTSNIEPNMPFTSFAKLLFELTRTSLFRISNELECVHLLVIELEHPIFGFERLNIELRTLFDPSLKACFLCSLPK